MPEFMYTIQPTRPAMLMESTPEEDAIVMQHFAYLKMHTLAGTVVMAGRTLNTDDSAFGIVIFMAEDPAAAEAFMQNDPAVQGGVMQATLFPYRVALLSGDYPPTTA